MWAAWCWGVRKAAAGDGGGPGGGRIAVAIDPAIRDRRIFIGSGRGGAGAGAGELDYGAAGAAGSGSDGGVDAILAGAGIASARADFCGGNCGAGGDFVFADSGDAIDFAGNAAGSGGG